MINSFVRSETIALTVDYDNLVSINKQVLYFMIVNHISSLPSTRLPEKRDQ